MSRGRPKSTVIEEDSSDKFERVYKSEDGCTEIWRYDTKRNSNGPYEVIINYPKNFEKENRSKKKKK
jgi:hypothetical protein